MKDNAVFDHICVHGRVIYWTSSYMIVDNFGLIHQDEMRLDGGNFTFWCSRCSWLRCKQWLFLRSGKFQLSVLVPEILFFHVYQVFWWHFKNAYKLLNLRALKFWSVNKMHIFQCMGKILCVEFQRVPLKFHTKYPTHTLKDAIFIQHWILESLRSESL